MAEKVLIFGIAGFVGKYLAKEFNQHGYKVFGSDVLDIDRPDYIEEYFNVNLLNKVEVESIILNIKPDKIINLAAISSVGLSWKSPQNVFEVNVIGALNILEAVRKLDNKPRILLIGSSEEYAPSQSPLDEYSLVSSENPYGISKVALEMLAKTYLKHYKVPVFLARSFNHTGVGQKDSFVIPSFCKQLSEIEKSRKPGVLKVGNLEVIRDFSHVEDIVRGYRLILERGNLNSPIYNIGSGHGYKLIDLLNYLKTKTSVEVNIEVSKDLFRPSDNPVIICDNSKISKDIGWIPKKTVYDAINELLEDYREKIDEQN